MKIDPAFEIRAAAYGSWEHMVDRLWQWDDDYKTKTASSKTYELSGDKGEDARLRYPLREQLTREFLRALSDRLEEELREESKRRSS